MRIAITGASGYVGNCISNCLRAHGHEVLALSRRRCAEPWISYTLGDDPLLLPWDNVDVLIHAAYDFTPRTWQEILNGNVMPSIELLQAATHAKVGRLIFISSLSSFEGCRSNYGKAKFMVELEAQKLGAVIIRPGLVWSEPSGGVMGTLEQLVAKLPAIPFLTGSKNLKQFLIHQEDLSATILETAETTAPVSGTLHSVTHPNPVSLLAILKSIAKRSHRSRLYVPIPWQLVMMSLKFMESLGIRSSFRSDSLVGLVHGNPHFEITPSPAGICYRPFH